MSELMWQKSSFSEGGTENCVELASSFTRILYLRESDDPHTVLATTPERLSSLLNAVRRHGPGGIDG